MSTTEKIIWPRIRDLPKEHQEGFKQWLIDYAQTVPWIDGAPESEQDGYYPWDYNRWRPTQ